MHEGRDPDRTSLKTRAAYEKPALVNYGRITALTAGGSQQAASEFRIAFGMFVFQRCGPERMVDPAPAGNPAFMC